MIAIRTLLALVFAMDWLLDNKEIPAAAIPVCWINDLLLMAIIWTDKVKKLLIQPS
ncbi:hypothetical protein D3C86_1973930 [compost metagenome]